jgi:hypothetical protein
MTLRWKQGTTARHAADVNVDMQPEIHAVARSVPDQQEIERRRNLVRIFFNDFWSEASNKPAAFVERLDQAEGYLNDRLAANGEGWRLDAKTRHWLHSLLSIFMALGRDAMPRG